MIKKVYLINFAFPKSSEKYRFLKGLKRQVPQQLRSMEESTLLPLLLGRSGNILCSNRPKPLISFRTMQIAHFKSKENIQEVIK